MSAANIVDAPIATATGLPSRYRLEERLGAGAAGETFAAVDQSNSAACVVKIFAPDDGARRLALSELRGLESLVHPNLARLRDLGRCEDGRLFLVTDRIVGTGLDSVAAIGEPAERRALFEGVALDLASALAHLHARGIVHGDVCPANVRLSSGDGDRRRAVLIDFGLAGPPMAAGNGARGTLGYAAPEALTGARTPSVDLFALGATLFEAWSGSSPFGQGLPAVQRMLEGRAPALSSIRPGLDAGWDRLLDRLLASDAAERPSSAREVLREIRRLSSGSATPTEIDLAIPYPEGDPLAGIVVGRRSERAALRAALDKLSDGMASASALVLVGAIGSGRRTLFDVGTREVAMAAAAGTGAAVAIWRGELDALERSVGLGPLSSGDDAQRAAEARMAALAEALEVRARERPLCVFLEEGAAAQLFAAFVAGAPPTGRVLVVIPAAAPIDRPFATSLELAPLTASELGELIRAGVEIPPPPAALEELARIARGNVALAVALARRLIADLRSGLDARAVLEPGADLEQLLRRSFAALAGGAQRLVLAVALAGPHAALVAALEDDAAAEASGAARAAGWLDFDGQGTVRLPSAAHHDVALAAAPPELARAIAAAALRVLTDDHRRTDALVIVGRPGEAAEILRRRAAVAREQGAGPRAAALLERAMTLAPESLDFDERLTLATGLAILGRTDDAERVLTEARERAGDPGQRAAVCERQAWLRARRGDIDGARATLEAGLAASAEAGLPAVDLRARLARLLITAGRFREALAIVEPLLKPRSQPPVEGGPIADANLAGSAVCVESALLAGAYLGDLPRARQLLVRLAGMPEASETRLAYLEGLLAQLGGEEHQAREAYRRAYESGSRQGDVHTVAAVALNLGGLLTEEGLFGEALTACARAVRELGRLGATAELVPALVNAANLFVELGDLPAARRALDRAQGLGAPGVPTPAAATAAFVHGDLARRSGQLDAAVGHYRAAAALFERVAQPASGASALLASVDPLVGTGQIEAARMAFEEASRLRGSVAAVAADPEPMRAQAILTLALAGADGAMSPPDLAARLLELARRTRSHRPRAWRLAVLAARLGVRGASPERAREALDLARVIFQEVRMATPEHHRAALEGDPDTAWLSAEGPGPSGGEPLAARAMAAESRLRRLLRINKRLNSELRLPRLLEMIVDTVIELTDAERGFLLLEDEGGELNVKVARNIDQQTLATAEFELSRSIARRAAEGGTPIVTIDAAGDARFREALSVSDLHLRSVLAVPLVIKGRAAGTIYVDHRLRKGNFDQEDVRLVLDFAEQAAIALENARLLAELRRRERQVEALNRRLETELAARREELTGIKVELRESREALAVRYDYRNIVGRTPRMLELFRLIDRITDTALSVVIQGESGTGKELVAHALHANGPRKDRPFVSENCAAIPETLLESTLFGYVRGAFTGAEHDTRGLFEIADGGTLFLDEVGEMSPGMQGKLLRVLQQGEIRRVGSERTRKVDVRVVAATNRDLAQMVEEGKFRRDLFFRLNVATIALPPLRERRDDIPLMVETFLAKQAKAAGRPASKPIDPSVLACLMAYRWPGNVRELENEMIRADALSGPRIALGDLSPRIAAGDPAGGQGGDDPDNLSLKPRVERLERSLLREALGRSGNNQTKAADLLGLSRFGLQKKLKRYNFVV